MFLASLAGDAAWLGRYAVSRAGERVPWALVERSLRATHPYAVFAVRGMLSVPFFEKALYELPEARVTPEEVLALADATEARPTPYPLPPLARRPARLRRASRRRAPGRAALGRGGLPLPPACCSFRPVYGRSCASRRRSLCAGGGVCGSKGCMHALQLCVDAGAGRAHVAPACCMRRARLNRRAPRPRSTWRAARRRGRS